jgi:hypothetical protein
MKLYFIGVLLIISFKLTAQCDTIFTNNETIACTVKEIAPEEVKYTLLGKELVNSIYKNTVLKIIFKNGRIQNFATKSILPTIEGLNDYKNIKLCFIPSEIIGFEKIDNIFSKSSGATMYSDSKTIRDRAINKLKIKATLLGGKVIYITNQKSEGGASGFFLSNTTNAQTNIDGLVYTDRIVTKPNLDKILTAQNSFGCNSFSKFAYADNDVTTKSIDKKFTIDSSFTDDKNIMVSGHFDKKTENKDYKVIYLENNFIGILHKDEEFYYYYKLNIAN